MKNKIFAVCLCFFGINITAYADITDSIYTLAKANLIDLKGIQNIDVVNDKGSTALCLSIIDGDVDTYIKLVRAGANSAHECIKQIPEKEYSNFIDRVEKNKLIENLAAKKAVTLDKLIWTSVGGIGVGAVIIGATAILGTMGNDDNYTTISYALNNTEQSNETDINHTVNTQNTDTSTNTTNTHNTDNTDNTDNTTEIDTSIREALDLTAKTEYVYSESDVCPNGYRKGSSYTLLSGETIYKCDSLIQCAYTTTTCGIGYHPTGNECKFGAITYIECAENACEGYTETCPDGWNSTSTCVSGTKTKYKCDTKISCPYETTECSDGYYETGNTCKSGNITYKECAVVNCAGFDYSETDSCPQGWTKGSSCLSGSTRKYKCNTATTCDGFTETRCVGGWEETGESCQSGNTLYVKCRQITCNSAQNLQWSDKGCVCKSGYGKNSNGDCVAKIADKQGRSIDNKYYTTIYGVRNNSNSHKEIGSKEIDISNNSDSDIFAVYGDTDYSGGALYNVTYTSNPTETYEQSIIGTITINNRKDGTIKGVYSDTKNNANASAFIDSFKNNFIARVTGNINITNVGNGDVFGVVGQYNAFVESGASNTENIGQTNMLGNIKINNTGLGNIYGLYNDDPTKDLYNAKTQEHGNGHLVGTGATVGNIYVKNNGFGNAYGMYGNKELQNAIQPTINADSVTTTGNINIVNVGAGNAYAMYGNTANTVENKSTENIHSSIIVNNIGAGIATGIYSNGGNINNSGEINLNNLDVSGTIIGLYGTSNIINSGNINVTNQSFTDFTDTTFVLPPEHGGTAYGIYACGGNVNNTGTITIDGMTTAYGIYAKPGTTVTNSGEITIANTENAYGIYAESGATVINSGTITINNVTCNGTECDNNEFFIVLNGADLFNGGQMSALRGSLNLNTKDGAVIAIRGASFSAQDSLVGNLNLSSDFVLSGNDTTYVVSDMIHATDVSDLNLQSMSAMFDASLANNGHDVIMQMKKFDEFTDNSSLATFLANNYTSGNNSILFSQLKSIKDINTFKNTLSNLSGISAFTQFAHEDMSAMREIGFSINQQIFINSDKDEYDINGSMNHFSFSSDYSDGYGRYGISTSKISDKWKLGYGLAMANINTGDNDGTSRRNNMGFFYMPITYTGTDFSFTSTPKVGFSKSYYTRSGYNNNSYKGYIEKHILGITNEAQYPIKLGNLTIAPNMAFNVIMYNQSGHENKQDFNLLIPTDTIFTMEMGLGLYGKYDKSLSIGRNLQFNSGLMLYREMADNYNIKLGIRNLSGSFYLYGNNDYIYRGSATFGVDYSIGLLSLYGTAQYFVDNSAYTSIKTGFKRKF